MFGDAEMFEKESVYVKEENLNEGEKKIYKIFFEKNKKHQKNRSGNF